MKTFLHLLIILGSFLTAFIWSQTFLVSYTVQALGFLVIIYVLVAVITRRNKKHSELINGPFDIFALNTTILLLITVTGNLYSPLFFLLYFLGFGITFIFEPASVFVFVIGAIALFLPEALKNGSIESFIRLGSLILISPLAFFFGQEYKDNDKQKEEIEKMADRSNDAGKTIEKNVDQVLEDEKDVLPEKEKEKLEEVKNEAKDLTEEKPS